MNSKLNLIGMEFSRTFSSNNVNKFYLYSIIVWPIMSFMHLIYNLQAFSLKTIKIIGINTDSKLLYYMFIGYCSYVLFSNAVQNSWRLSKEKNQGTLTQIYLSPTNKIFWLFSRSVATVMTTSWLYVGIFVFANFIYVPFSIKQVILVLLATLVMLMTTIIWSAFISSFFILLRDGSLLFIILEGPQETLVGYKFLFQFLHA